LRKGIEAMFFAYRGFTADPDRILDSKGYGRAHHRAIHFINRSPGHDGQQPADNPGCDQAVAQPRLADADRGWAGGKPRRASGQARASPVPDRAGRAGAAAVGGAAARMRAAYRVAGPEAVAGFRQVLEAMMDPEMRRQFNAMKEGT
jgi:hypothetical protein